MGVRWEVFGGGDADGDGYAWDALDGMVVYSNYSTG